MERALPVDEYVAFDSSVEDTGDISNMSAEQYLSWVRYQAQELPDVFRADIDSSLYAGRQTKYMPDIEQVVVCPEHLLPSTEWERDVISAFSDLRALLARLSTSESSRERKLVVPQLKDEQAWHKFCLGSECSLEECSLEGSDMKAMEVEEAQTANFLDAEQRKLELSRSLGISDVSEGAEGISDSGPVVSGEHESDDEEQTGIPAGATQRRGDGTYATWSGVEDSLPTTSLLLQFDQVMTQRLLGYQVSWLEDRESMSSARGQWLYGLLARLEKPLDRDMASLLRELYRRCSQLRATLDENMSSFDVQIASLNVLIAITGSYFGQGEEYSTLTVGYGDDEVDEGEEDDDDDDEENDDDYYFTGDCDEQTGEIFESYRIGDDIWNDRTAMAVETDPISVRNYDDSNCDKSYCKKRVAEISAEEGEEVEDI